ncbi:MAG: hypothetical protein SNJ59_16470 [Aggregatilineales bacterium]
MAANVEAMVREGVKALKAGRKEEANVLLLKAVELDPYNEDAWLWLSGIVESPEDQRTCLENVLSINPNNARARSGLAYLDKISASASSSTTPPAQPFVSVSTSVEWQTPPETSSPSARWSPSQDPTALDYDDWVSSLNLAAPEPAAPTTSKMPFVGFEDNATLDEVSIFADGPFQVQPVAPAEPPATPFQFSKPPLSAALAENDPFAFATDLETEEQVSELSPFEAAIFKQAEQFSLRDDIDRDRDGILEESEGALFGVIPASIRPTRLPGTRERAPLFLILAIIMMGMLNLGAGILLASRFILSA